ncbi:MAG: methyltransferase domain-containing protein [Cyanobacteria bacterium P01_D01_bin.50]
MTNFTILFTTDENELPHQEEYFYLLTESGQELRLRIHDYPEVYQIPGLYEYLVCEKLQYQAPQVISKLLIEQTTRDGININDLSILDVGAGNGISGKALTNLGVTSIFGLDIIPESTQATQRDYPGVYQQYYVEDLACLSEQTYQELKNKKLNVLLFSGSLYHLPFKALCSALSLLEGGGWLAITLRTSEMKQIKSENARYLFETLVNRKALKIIAEKEYQQRLTISGKPMMGVAIIAKIWAT